MLTKYESVTQKVLFIIATRIFASLMSGRKYDYASQMAAGQENVRTLVFRNKIHYQNAALLQDSISKRSTFM
jgi:hypothetical protein